MRSRKGNSGASGSRSKRPNSATFPERARAYRCRPDDHDVSRARGASLAALRCAGFGAARRDDRALRGCGESGGRSRSHVAPARWSSPPAFVLFAQGKEGGVTPPHYVSLFEPAFHKCAAQYARASDEQFLLARPFSSSRGCAARGGRNGTKFGSRDRRLSFYGNWWHLEESAEWKLRSTEFAFSFRNDSPGRSEMFV
jgi:hypothetical protein